MGSHGRKQYAADFKRDAVAHVTQQGYSVEAAQNLGVNAGLLPSLENRDGADGDGRLIRGIKRPIRRNGIICGKRTGGSGWNGIF